MKRIGFLAAALTLLLVGAAPDDKTKTKELPGFPAIKYSDSLLEPYDKDHKPLLKVIRVETANEGDRKYIAWLIELQTDINFEEKKAIDGFWFNAGESKGPGAYFFDKDHVALYRLELKLAGKLYEGKKGDCIRLLLEIGPGFPGATTMEIRKL